MFLGGAGQGHALLPQAAAQGGRVAGELEPGDANGPGPLDVLLHVVDEQALLRTEPELLQRDAVDGRLGLDAPVAG